GATLRTRTIGTHLKILGMGGATGRHSDRDSWSLRSSPASVPEPLATPRALPLFHAGALNPWELGTSCESSGFPQAQRAGEIVSRPECAWAASSESCRLRLPPFAPPS